jgi:hypothetical protein
MSHPETQPHGHHDGELPYFPAAEWEAFHKDDITAGKAVILLISGIFTVGLVLYTIVALTVRATPLYLG